RSRRRFERRLQRDERGAIQNALRCPGTPQCERLSRYERSALERVAARTGHAISATALSECDGNQTFAQRFRSARLLRRRAGKTLRSERGVLARLSGLGGVGAGRNSRYAPADDVQAREPCG